MEPGSVASANWANLRVVPGKTSLEASQSKTSLEALNSNGCDPMWFLNHPGCWVVTVGLQNCKRKLFEQVKGHLTQVDAAKAQPDGTLEPTGTSWLQLGR